jgi:hypothetical protein
MTGWTFARYALSIFAAVIVPMGCGALPFESAQGKLAQGDTPIGVAPTTVRNAAIRADARPLLYVTGLGPPNTVIYGYTYPAGKYVRQIGEYLTAVTICVGATGNLFVNYALAIIEYAHNGKELAAMKDHLGPRNCSVDPRNGNLAVANDSRRHGQGGSISIFRRGEGTGTVHIDSQIDRYDSLSYDDKGNILFDGLTSDGASAFAELHRDGRTFTSVTVQPRLTHPGKIQWDGAHFAVGIERSATIRQVDVSGSTGKIVGKTQLEGCKFTDFFIVGDHVVASCGDVRIFNYPAGGAPVRVFRRLVPGVLQLVVSE